MSDDVLAHLQTHLKAAYRVERKIGEGGMATVYLARDLKHDRNVAIKTLKSEVASSIGPDRFLREIEIASKLQHPHIIPVYDSGDADGVLFYRKSGDRRPLPARRAARAVPGG